jgi:hypothetical protein
MNFNARLWEPGQNPGGISFYTNRTLKFSFIAEALRTQSVFRNTLRSLRLGGEISVCAEYRSFCQELSHLHQVNAGDVADRFVRGNVSRTSRKNGKQGFRSKSDVKTQPNRDAWDEVNSTQAS